MALAVEPGVNRLARRGWRRGSATGVVLLAAFLALVVLVGVVGTLVGQQIADLQASIDQAQQDVDDLNAQVARWSDPAYIQAQARERLYYILPGDISYLIVGQPQEQSGQGDLPISDEIQTTQTDWIGGLLGSVYTAGLTDETPAQLDSPDQVDSPRSDSGKQ